MEFWQREMIVLNEFAGFGPKRPRTERTVYDIEISYGKYED